MKKLFTVAMAALLCASVQTVFAQPVAIPLSAFGTGYGVQSGSGNVVRAFVGEAAIGRSAGGGDVILVGFLSGATRLGGGIVSVPELREGIPSTFDLEQNYPNPFNPTTTIRYQIPAANRVQLKLYDLLGQEVATLFDDVQEPGRYRLVFDANGLASGMYVYRLQAGSFVNTKKLLLLK
ncbi:MAG: T9SS type A sorting domain-containing protein [Ignavibacteriae bacterium]|nr:T9SS type A sorting domain-containing protein [Ignavibacteriota bacterium]